MSPSSPAAAQKGNGVGKGFGFDSARVELNWKVEKLLGGWMEQCRAMVVGPRELDLAGHGGRRKEGGEREVARRRGSRATYRPESTWARGVLSGGGWFGPGRLDGGGRSEQAASCMAGRRGSSGVPQGRVSSWGDAKGQARWRWRGSLGPFGRGRAVDKVHRWRTAGGRRAKQSTREERDGGEGLFVNSKSSGTYQ